MLELLLALIAELFWINIVLAGNVLYLVNLLWISYFTEPTIRINSLTRSSKEQPS